jgi:protoporphyrinogen/coproporphyrinogen III oxidase
MAVNGQGQADGLPHVVIAGGGIAGLAAAFFLRDAPVRLTVLEAGTRIGGQLAVSPVAGVDVDEGADMTWRPKTGALITAAGLGDRLTLAATNEVAMWTRGKLRPLPEAFFMGVPADMDQLAATGIISEAGVERARRDLEMPATPRPADTSVQDRVAPRLGQEVVERLVNPFLYEMCGGQADRLSYEATLSLLATTSDKHASLAQAAGSLVTIPHPKNTGIASIDGGLGTLAPALAATVLAASPDADIRTSTTLTGLTRSEQGWQLTVTTPAGPETIDADAVILAVPAPAVARLLGGVPGTASAAAELAAIPYASVVDITLAYPRESFPADLAASGLGGYRVPVIDGGLVRSVTFSTVKYNLPGDFHIIRCSAGGISHGDVLQRDDADLVAQAATEVAQATGITGPPAATRVTRWPDALPQYAPGQRDRAARIRATLAAQPGLAVCGAAYDGVGVGFCMGSARKATESIRAQLDSTIPRKKVRV